MAERLAVTDDGKADQSDALRLLRTRLETQGFMVNSNNLAGRDNDCKWYAWRRLPVGSADCECNDKPPSLIVTPQLYTMRDRQYTSAEVTITGQRGEWFQLKAYSVNPETLPETLPQIEAALVRAWNAVAATPLPTHPQQENKS